MQPMIRRVKNLILVCIGCILEILAIYLCFSTEGIFTAEDFNSILPRGYRYYDEMAIIALALVGAALIAHGLFYDHFEKLIRGNSIEPE